MKAYEIGRKETVVFYLHGLRGHAFAQVSALRHMVKNLGVRVVTLELPGHGHDSVRQQCMVPPYCDIVDMIVDEIKVRANDAEQVVLMGYSFGGALMSLVACRLEQDRRFRVPVVGLVGISTALSVSHNVSRWQLAMSGLIAPISRYLHGRMPRLSRVVTIGEMNVSLISPDRQVQKAISSDRKIYKGRMPLYTSAQVYKASLSATQALKSIQAPTLLLHSADDKIALPPQASDFPDNVVIKMFKKLRHNCIDGVTREAVVARKAITRFIADKL